MSTASSQPVSNFSTAPPSVAHRSSFDFAELCRAVSDQARRLELAVPSFRSPPRIVGLSRTARRRPDGSVTIAVAFRNRPWGAVQADVIEGVVIANGLTGTDAARSRDELWGAIAHQVQPAA